MINPSENITFLKILLQEYNVSGMDNEPNLMPRAAETTPVYYSTRDELSSENLIRAQTHRSPAFSAQ